jgi:hypothetical protein
MAKSKKKSSTEDVPKNKSLFDHINQIRNVKNPKYFSSLTEGDKKSFNHYMICRFLSMDSSCINEVSYLTKIFDKMDSNSFYKVACALVNPVKFTPYLKSKSEKFNEELIGFVSLKYGVSKSDANDYCKTFMCIENGVDALTELCRGYGLSDKEIEKILNRNED